MDRPIRISGLPMTERICAEAIYRNGELDSDKIWHLSQNLFSLRGHFPRAYSHLTSLTSGQTSQMHLNLGHLQTSSLKNFSFFWLCLQMMSSLAGGQSQTPSSRARRASKSISASGENSENRFIERQEERKEEREKNRKKTNTKERKKERKNEWMNEWMNEWKNGWTNGWTTEYMHEWMKDWMNGWRNGWMNG